MKITLCGSTRFMDQYHAWNRWLALQGWYSRLLWLHPLEMVLSLGMARP
ncbi:hypothetical protein LCGC14_2623130 [marine sediment metagenome]|uniref:Uncharacterized protein n=1 Tax=marine sediment metagenome TaxID=412755 RepID=A0A0F9CV49_9ZZZZ